MAISLLSHVVADLCLGKPPLKSLSLSKTNTTTVGDVLSAIKSSDESSISIWSCDHSNHSPRKLEGPNNNNNSHNIDDFEGLCECVGKICMVDIICFLCKEENLASPASALLSPVSAILKNSSGLVKHVDPSTSLLEAIDLIVHGAQNLVVPIQNKTSRIARRKQLIKATNNGTNGCTFHNGLEYCWLTQEDVIQFILSRIGSFTPIPNMSVEELGIIQTKILTVDYHTPATMALDAIARSLATQTSVGVVDEDGGLVGEISPFTLASCDETVAAAIMTLSCGDLMSYIDWGGPPDDIIRVMKERLTEKKLDGLLEMLDDDYSSYGSASSSSSDDESTLSSSSLTSTKSLTRYNRSWSYSARMVRKAEAIVCHPRSSLIAVMIQALAHRVNYVWVMEDDCTLVGIVTFRDMLEVFREHLLSMIDEWE